MLHVCHQVAGGLDDYEPTTVPLNDTYLAELTEVDPADVPTLSRTQSKRLGRSTSVAAARKGKAAVAATAAAAAVAASASSTSSTTTPPAQAPAAGPAGPEPAVPVHAVPPTFPTSTLTAVAVADTLPPPSSSSRTSSTYSTLRSTLQSRAGTAGGGGAASPGWRSAGSTMGGGRTPSLKVPEEVEQTLKRTLPPAAKADPSGDAYPDLLTLVATNNAAALEAALARQAAGALDVATIRTQHGWTALHAAANASASAVIGLLLGAGLDVDAPDADGNTPLFVATRFNGVDTMTQLVARKAQAQRRNAQGRTMLQEAIYREAERAFRWILERSGPSEARQPGGEALNATGPEWWRTSLIMAIAELVEVDTYVVPLLAAGADPREPTASGQTPLQYAVLRDHTVAARALLRAHPALVNEVLATSWTRTPLNLAIVERKTVALVRTLLDAGADGSIEDSEGHTALETAIVHGEDSGRLLQTLLAHPSTEPLAFRVSAGWWRTPLHLAARLDKPEHIRLLFEAGGGDLDVNAEDERGRTPLVLALVENCANAFAVLMQLPGVDINHVSSKPWRGPVHAAIAFNSFALLPKLLAHPAIDWSQRDIAERTAAEFAVAANALEALRMIVPAYVSPRAETPPTRRTLLHVAVQFNRPEMVRLLLQLGANPNAKNAQGSTPRQLAQALAHRLCVDEFNMHDRATGRA